MGVTTKYDGFGADRRLRRFNGGECREVPSRILRITKIFYLRVVVMRMVLLASEGWISGFYNSG